MILIEGANFLGKTTLAAKITEHMRLYLTSRKMDPARFKSKKFGMELRACSDTDVWLNHVEPLCVVDRFHISNIIYGRHSGVNCLGNGACVDIDRAIDAAGGLTVVLWEDETTYMARCREHLNGDLCDKSGWSAHDMQAINNRFRQVAEKFSEHYYFLKCDYGYKGFMGFPMMNTICREYIRRQKEKKFL